jgi:hypothetical protein
MARIEGPRKNGLFLCLKHTRAVYGEVFRRRRKLSVMKANTRYSTIALCTVIVLSFVWAARVLATDADEVTIIGTVYAVDWDEKGNVIAAVMSGTGEEYQIAGNAVGQQLFKLDKKTVKATGVIGEDSRGNKSLTVTQYEVVPK